MQIMFLYISSNLFEDCISFVQVCSISNLNNVQDEAYYNKLSEPTDEENDMLDLAFGLTET